MLSLRAHIKHLHLVFLRSYNHYSIIAGRALARSLNENARVAAEKRGLSSLKFQTWEGGKASEAVSSLLLRLTLPFGLLLVQ